MLLAVLDHLPGLDQARRILTRLLAAVPPGSFPVISHAASDIDPRETAEMIARLNEHLAEDSHTGRPREVIARLFDGLDLIEPGVVKVTQWHPRSELEAIARTCMWRGVAQARHPARLRQRGRAKKTLPSRRRPAGPGDGNPVRTGVFPEMPAGRANRV